MITKRYSFPVQPPLYCKNCKSRSHNEVRKFTNAQARPSKLQHLIAVAHDARCGLHLSARGGAYCTRLLFQAQWDTQPVLVSNANDKKKLVVTRVVY
jgi:hypothetical protein